jgi:drug/metabolite transporter (DMT)-like permease
MHRSHTGTLIMLLSAVFFAAMAALIRSTPEVNSYVLGMARFVVGTLVCMGMFAVKLDKPRWVNWPWIVVRGVIGSIAVVIFFWSIQSIGLAKATVMNYTYAIWAAVFAVPMLGERLRLSQWAMVALAMVGVCLLFEMHDFRIAPADLIALCGGVCSGIAVIAITRCRDTDSSANVFWSQSLFGIVAVAWPMATHWTPPTLPQYVPMVGVGLLAALGQLLMTYAYKHTGATQGSLVSLFTPVLGGVIGVLYFHEPFSLQFGVGALLILIACAYLAFNPVERGPDSQADLATGEPVM